MKRMLWALAVLAGLVLTAGSALAAESSSGATQWVLTATAEAGFEGKAKSGSWVPVTVTLKNDGEEFTGAIEFEVTAANGGPVGRHVGLYRTPVVVPAGATKKITVYVPTEFMGLPQLDVVSGGERVARLQPVLDLTAEALVGVLGVEPADLPGLAGHVLADGRTVRLVRLEAATVPSEAAVLENLEAVLLDRFAYAELPEPQRRALQAWVEHGGTLILAGGPEARLLEGLSPWIPLSRPSVRTAALAGVGTASLSDFDLAEWEPLRRLGAETVVARYRKGMGNVYLLLFDPALEPFASWQGLPALVGGLVPGMSGYTVMGKGAPGPMAAKAYMVLLDTLNQFPMREIPSVKGLLALLAGYALLVGPVHFLMLKGFRRVGWALLTLPLLAGAGGLGAWGFARNARAAEVLTNTVSVLEGQPGSESLKVHTLTGFFLPPASSHKVALGDALLMPVPSPYVPTAWGGTPAELELRSTLEGMRVATLEPRDDWSMFAMSAETMVPVSGTVTGTLTVNADGLTGELTSRLPFRLENALLISGTSFRHLGDLFPGDIVDASLPLPAITQNFGGDNPLAEVLAQAQQFQGFARPQATPEEIQLMRRQQISWAASQAISWVTSPNRPNAVVAGWTDYQALPVSIDGRQVETGAMALYVQPVTLTVSPEAFTLPSTWQKPRLVDTGGPVQFSIFHQGWSLGEGESLTMEFDVPPAVLDRVTQVDVEVQLTTFGRGPSGKYPVEFQFMRWSDSTWHNVPVGGVDAASPENDRAFISPDGVVRVKVTQVDRDRVPLAVPGMTIRGGGVQP